MESIQKFLKIYLNQKIKIYNINAIINFLIFGFSLLIIIIKIEESAYFSPYIKHRILTASLILSSLSILFLILRTLIHKYNLWENSNPQALAYQLIDKIPTKDRIINALQIYSKLDLNNSYSDLTINSINQLEDDIKKINLNKIKIYFPYRKFYTLIILLLVFISFILLSEQYYYSIDRLLKKEIKFNKPLPFKIMFENYKNEVFVFKDDKLTAVIKGEGITPEKIILNIKTNNKIDQVEINNINQSYSYTLKKIKNNTKIWASYINKSILPYKRYKIVTDTLNINLKTRPEFKDLKINIIPPIYTNITEVEHNQSLRTIQLLNGSNLKIEGILNKKIKDAKLKFNNDSIINMNVINNNINVECQIVEPLEFEIICTDFERNQNIPINYSIIINDDLKPYVNIKYPNDNLKINEKKNIKLEVEIVDDFGIKEAFLEYYILKPYYLDQDTTLNNIQIFNTSKNKKNQFISYNWDIKDLNIGPGDEIFYWVKALDNNTKTGPGIGKSKILKAYFPSLEELYFEVEEEQEIVEQNFGDMIDSIDDIKNMYKEISNDVLKEKTGFEQEQTTKKISTELEEISEKIKDLENTIKTIDELNDKNNLINDALGDKIQQLQNMFKDIISSELMEALQNIQQSLDDDDFKKSLEELNDFNFEINDLEQQVDRMIDLFEQIVAEQKLNELTKKLESMYDLQKEISEKINEDHRNKNIKPMENKQKNNLNDLENVFNQTSDIMKNIDQKISEEINQLSSSKEFSDTKKDINSILNSQNSKSNMNQNSNNIEKNLKKMSSELEKIIEEYQQKLTQEMLNMYSRIIKNLIDMSYGQEELIEIAKNVKSKKDNTNITELKSKENVLLQQYKNIFIQISDLTKKSFHISAETSKTFSQIFNHLIKTINAFEQGEIKNAKKNQIAAMEYINKTILLLIDAMENMQSSGEASGYSQYLESMENLMSGQQSLNQGMNSLIPMPFGQQPGQQGLMQSLMKQQQNLKNQLEKLMKENSFSSSENQGEGLGKALENMDKIIKDFENNNISQESINRGEQVYRKLLEHKNSLRNRGFNENWEAEQNDNNLLDNNLDKIENSNNIELKKLYKKLDELDNNKNITRENKSIIQEYLRILIEEKINEK